MNVTRGFTGRPRVHNDGLPPGQYDAGDDWPVLSAEVTPDLAPADWTFRVDGLVAEPRTWDWDEAHALPPSAYEGDIHCVTSWSKFGVRFGGVSLDAFLDAVRPDAERHARGRVLAHRVHHEPPARRLTGGRAWIVWEYGGRAAARRARWSGAADRAAPVLLEERQVDRGPAAPRPRRAGLLGAERLPRTAATPGKSSATPVTETAMSARTPRRRPASRRRRASPCPAGSP